MRTQLQLQDSSGLTAAMHAVQSGEHDVLRAVIADTAEVKVKGVSADGMRGGDRKRSLHAQQEHLEHHSLQPFGIVI